MPKRQRDDTEDQGRGPSKRVSTDDAQKRAGEKIFHGKKIIHRALKLAKGFERQKLSRRQKTAKQKDDAAELKRIEEEIEALKNLDLVLAAEAHLHKVLNKEKAIATCPALPTEVTVPPRAIKDKATVNVTARLYNANPVKEAVSEVLPPIRAALGVKLENPKAKSKRGKDVKQQAEKTSNKSRLVARQSAEDDSIDTNENVSEEDSDDVPREPQTGGLASDLEDDDFAAYDARVAGSSDDENDDDDNDGNEHSTSALDTRPARERTYSPSVGYSPSPSASASPPPRRQPSLSLSPPPEPQRAAKTKAQPQKQANTTFLPSLTLGGYFSGSDSGAESAPEDISEAVRPRTNRRGQRARQQIWEKKFGQKAKHLENGGVGANGKQGGKAGRDDGWDMKRGASSARAKGRPGEPYKPAWAKGREERGARGAGATGENATALGGRRQELAGGVKEKEKEKPMHASWVAAKKAKEAKKFDINTFKGKKVSFD